MIGDRDNLEPGTKQNCPHVLRLLMRHVLHTETQPAKAMLEMLIWVWRQKQTRVLRSELDPDLTPKNEMG